VKQRVRHAESSVYAFGQTYGNNSCDNNNNNNSGSTAAAAAIEASNSSSSSSGWLIECTGISPASWSSAASALACCLFEQKWVDLTCAELTDQVCRHLAVHSYLLPVACRVVVSVLLYRMCTIEQNAVIRRGVLDIHA
jgi:hypothetical protein